MYTFPFGRPVVACEPARHQGGLFVLGAYPSALHARWTAPDGTTIKALAVDNEPSPFWNGDDQAERIDAWKQTVGFRDEWGSVEPVGASNGSSGAWVDEQILTPLGAARDQAWITDCLDTYRASEDQAEAIADRFVPFAEQVGLESRPDLPKHPSEDGIVQEAEDLHLDRLKSELREAQPTTIVTLGNAALRVMRMLVSGAPEVERKLIAEPYGQQVLVDFEGRSVAWYPLVHPAGTGPVKQAHNDWVPLR